MTLSRDAEDTWECLTGKDITTTFYIVTCDCIFFLYAMNCGRGLG